MIKQSKGRVLIIAGSDSGGGAGIQADLKTVTALGGYGMTAITAVTAQNTMGVFGIHMIPAEFVVRQMRVVLDDIGADAIKVGMLGSAEIVIAVADMLDEFADIPVILDPVLISSSGSALLDDAGIAALKDRLFPKVALLTPNLLEAEVLAVRRVDSLASMEVAADILLTAGARNILVKGGHLDSDVLVDLLVGKTAARNFTTLEFTHVIPMAPAVRWHPP